MKWKISGKRTKEENKFREMGMLELIYYVKLEKPSADSVSWESLEDTSFTVWNIWEAPAPLTSSREAVLCRPGMALEDAMKVGLIGCHTDLFSSKCLQAILCFIQQKFAKNQVFLFP